MKTHSRRLPAAALTTAAVLAACAPAAVSVEHAWIRTPLPGKTVTAAYLDLVNRSGEARVLTGVSVEDFARVSVHETRLSAGLAEMVEVGALPLAAGERLEFRPGGLHLMLMQARRTIAAGDVLTVTLRFDDGSTVQVGAPVSDRAPR